MAGLMLVPTALSLPQMDPCNNPPTAQAFEELMSETSLDTPEAAAEACVLARRDGITGCRENVMRSRTP